MFDEEALKAAKADSDASSESGSQGKSTTLTVNKAVLNQESKELLNQIIAEKDPEKSKDLTYLFNQNQNKKTMIRVDKMNELLDLIADQTMARFTKRPDEISNQELLQGLKTVLDVIERGQKQVNGANDTPLIQINQQNNDIKVGHADADMSRESKDRVKAAVMAILSGIDTSSTAEGVIDAEVIDGETAMPPDNNDKDE